MFKKYIRTQEKNIRNKNTNKTKSKIVGLNPNISIYALYTNVLNISIKRKRLEE